MRRRDKQVLWPAYFDADHTRRQGRRVPKNLALREVKAEEILQAALDLGLNPDLLAGAVHSRHPWRRRGAVLVDKRGLKTRVVEDIARGIRERRGSK